MSDKIKTINMKGMPVSLAIREGKTRFLTWDVNQEKEISKEDFEKVKHAFQKENIFILDKENKPIIPKAEPKKKKKLK